MDNSKCKKPVKSFKVKLARKVSCLTGKVGIKKPVIRSTEYIQKRKYEGQAKQTNQDHTIDFQLPLSDKKMGEVTSLHPDLRYMVTMLSDSADNSLFKIEYELHVFVKHKSKLVRGMGSKVNFPIEIKSSQRDLQWREEKEQAWYERQDIQAWAPINDNPIVNLYTVKQPDGELKGINDQD